MVLHVSNTGSFRFFNTLFVQTHRNHGIKHGFELAYYRRFYARSLTWQICWLDLNQIIAM
jgi:hypothetical protein